MEKKGKKGALLAETELKEKKMTDILVKIFW